MADVVAMQNLSALMERLDKAVARFQRVESAITVTNPSAVESPAAGTDLTSRLRDSVVQLEGIASHLESAVGLQPEASAKTYRQQQHQHQPQQQQQL